jgi:hypothetical protein
MKDLLICCSIILGFGLLFIIVSFAHYLFQKRRKKMTLNEIARNYGNVRVTFDCWPKGKYFKMQTQLPSGEFAGTVYGDPELEKPTAAIKQAEGAKKWILYQTKTIQLAPALVLGDDGEYHVTRKLYKNEAEAREAFEDDTNEFVKLATERSVSLEVQV